MKNEIKQIYSVLNTVILNLHSASESEDELYGLSTGLPTLDKRTSGWQNSELVLFAGYEKMGLDKLLTSIALKMLSENETQIALFSMQYSGEQLVQRLLMNLARISRKNLLSAELTKDDWKNIDAAKEKLYNAHLYICDTPNPTLTEISEQAHKLVEEEGIEVVLIDNINRIKVNEGESVTESLKILARELDIPVVACLELKDRTNIQSRFYGKRPERSDFPEMENIFQYSDLLCFLHRPEYFHITEDKDEISTLGMAELILKTENSFEPEIITLRYEMEYGRFRED